jgi:hypothetical protein
MKAINVTCPECGCEAIRARALSLVSYIIDGIDEYENLVYDKDSASISGYYEADDYEYVVEFLCSGCNHLVFEGTQDEFVERMKAGAFTKCNKEKRRRP